MTRSIVASVNERQFWYWISERHKIYLARKAGKPWPWTDDEILQEYKFTNVYRQLDAVTVAWRERYQRIKKLPLYQQFQHLVVFRMFNWPPTYDILIESEALTKAVWNETYAKRILTQVTASREQVFTGAYIISNLSQRRPKLELICEAISEMHNEAKMIVHRIKNNNTLEGAVEILSQYPMVGKFIAYELACDLRYMPILIGATDVNTWANPGPGAQRGCNRIFRGDVKLKVPKKNYLGEMQELHSRAHLAGAHLNPALEMREIEHSLCEFDKYLRVKQGEGRPRSKFTQPEKRKKGRAF